MKKIFKILLLVLFSFIILGCEVKESNYIILPRLDGLTRSEIVEKLDKLGVRYKFVIEPRMYFNDEEFDNFVKYGNNLKAGSKIEKDPINGSINSYVYVYTTALPIPTLDDINPTINFNYNGTTYFNEGYEKVTLARCVDGDTAHFYLQNGEYIKIRFLGVDTPESTYEKDPWGKEASDFTSNILRNAKEIVIEREGNTTDSYGRNLAFVWADGVLINLEVIKHGYSSSLLSSSSKYFDMFYDAELALSKTGRKIWGEIDPNYDYEKEEFK